MINHKSICHYCGNEKLINFNHIGFQKVKCESCNQLFVIDHQLNSKTHVTLCLNGDDNFHNWNSLNEKEVICRYN